MQNTFSIELTKEQALNTKEILVVYGWVDEYINNPYAVFRMKSKLGSSVILYTSNKLVFQGNEDFTSLIGSLKGTEECKEEIVPHLGVDEVGKGDYFGPLVVVSFFLDKEISDKAVCIGIGDSKKFSDKRIMKMYNVLKEYPYYYASIVYPKEYNELYLQTGNASLLLARQHCKVIEMGLGDLKSKNIECSTVVIDQFSSRKDRLENELGKYGRESNIIQFHKGESDMAVACASVVARGIFLEEMDKMSKRYGFTFPKGSSNVIDQGKEFVSRFGKDELENVAKTTFKTTNDII